MKKWMLLTVAVVLVTIAVVAPAVFAQGPVDGYSSGYGRGAMVSGGQFGPGFVDEDGDGVSDLAGTGQGQGPGFVDEDGNGTCDNFVDEDGDGVSDYAGTGRQADRSARMMGRREQ